MLIRSLILLGLCAAIGVSAPAYAETTPAKTYLFPLKSKATEADAKEEKVEKKKLTAKKRS